MRGGTWVYGDGVAGGPISHVGTIYRDFNWPFVVLTGTNGRTSAGCGRSPTPIQSSGTIDNGDPVHLATPLLSRASLAPDPRPIYRFAGPDRESEREYGLLADQAADSVARRPRSTSTPIVLWSKTFGSGGHSGIAGSERPGIRSLQGKIAFIHVEQISIDRRDDCLTLQHYICNSIVSQRRATRRWSVVPYANINFSAISNILYNNLLLAVFVNVGCVEFITAVQIDAG